MAKKIKKTKPVSSKKKTTKPRPKRTTTTPAPIVPKVSKSLWQKIKEWFEFL